MRPNGRLWLVQCLPVIAILVVAAAALGQDTLGRCAGSSKIGCVIPNPFGRGITLPRRTPGEHEAHFYETQQFTENFLPLNTAIATQFALLPIASPASSFTYSYDRATGVHTR